jgi:hypothetical protein
MGRRQSSLNGLDSRISGRHARVLSMKIRSTALSKSSISTHLEKRSMRATVSVK